MIWSIAWLWLSLSAYQPGWMQRVQDMSWGKKWYIVKWENLVEIKFHGLAHPKVSLIIFTNQWMFSSIITKVKKTRAVCHKFASWTEMAKINCMWNFLVLQYCSIYIGQCTNIMPFQTKYTCFQVVQNIYLWMYTTCIAQGQWHGLG